MRAALLVLAASLAGCVVLPKTTKTTRQVQMYEAPPEVSASGGLIVDAHTASAVVQVRTQRARTCSHELRAVIETRTDKALSLVGGVSDRDGAGFAMLVELAVAPVSFVVSGVIVATSRPHREYDTQTVRRDEYACPAIAAGVPVAIALPSGASVRLTTDRAGALAFHIPDTEPARGIVIVRAGDTEARLAYSREN